MSTIIQSINKITEIKQDLNQILRDNGLEGGDVFADYPDKFRELFRVITSMTDATADGYKPSETDVATVVPAPSLRQYQNVVYVTNNMEEATIYYYVNTDSGNHNIGLTRLEKGNSIIVSEPSTVYVYAQYREIKSTTAQIYVPWNPEVVPDPPVIVRDGTTVTMTCNAGDEIYYATGSVGMSEWQKYEGPITVERYENIWAFAQNYRGRSDTIFDEAPEPLPLPDTPIIQCNLNVVEITCGTEGATIYYKKQTDKYYIEYTGPFSITQSDYYEAKAMKDGLYGGEAIEYCRYVEEPTAPVISCADNAVTITCEPAVETVIYYKIDDGEWQEYNGPILLTETVTITAYGNHYGVIGPSTTQECVYVAPIEVDEPEFSQIVNTVSITCDTEGADIWYRIDNADVWSLYEGPIDIDRDMQIQAYATVGNAISDTVTYNAQFIDAEEDAPAAPVGSCSNNVVTITCDTPNAEIYYRDINDGYWTKYEGEFLITESHTYVIYATKYGLVTYGTPFEAIYDESSTVPTAPNPAITYNPANHTVTITCSNPQATIYYSLDSGNWDEYTGPFEITADGYVYAYSKITGWRNSGIVMKYCRLEGDEPVTQTVATPVINFTDPVVTITCATSGASIYYSYNNSTWQRYAGNIILLESKTVYAKATKAGWNDSSVASRYCEIGGADVNEYLTFTANAGQTSYLAWHWVNTIELYYCINDGQYVHIPIADKYALDGTYGWKTTLDDNSRFTHATASDYVSKSSHTNEYVLKLNPGDVVKIYGNNPDGIVHNINGVSNIFQFLIQGSFSASGNIMSMISPSMPTTVPTGSSFRNMFWFCTDENYERIGTLTTAPALPATTITPYCYASLFAGTSITRMPALPATTLANDCYQYMFADCTSLTTVQSLPATTLADECYYYMFYNCTSLTTAPDLPALTLPTRCYGLMFNSCSSLNHVKALFTTIGTDSTYNWLDSVAATGTFIKNSSATWTETDIIPSGWTVQTA